MKYSLRSLMIAVTLVCVVLAGVMGRIEYLQRWAAFHEAEQAKHLTQWRQEYAALDQGKGSAASEASEREIYFRHKSLAKKYRLATYRPWNRVYESAP